MLVGEDPQVAELARLGQARLAGLAGLDVVPQEWLHMTTLIAGFADQIAPDQVDAMTSHARQLLASVPPITITLGRVLFHPRAVMLDAGPADALEPVLRAVQDATRLGTGRNGELYHEPWAPHITLAYSNASAYSRPGNRGSRTGATPAEGHNHVNQPGLPGTRAEVDMALGSQRAIRDRLSRGVRAGLVPRGGGQGRWSRGRVPGCGTPSGRSWRPCAGGRLLWPAARFARRACRTGPGRASRGSG